MNKRGLSRVVTTILLILLIIGAIAGIWVTINNFISKGSESLTFGNVGLDVAIKSAYINESDNIATIKITRNIGVSKENITAIKFIVEDPRNSEIFTIPVKDFGELSVRSFDLNLSKNGILNISNIYKISIAPVYISDSSGKKTTAPITSSFDIGEITKIITEIKVCQTNSDCGTDQWIDGSEICNSGSTGVLKYKKIYECFGAPNGFCQQKTEALPFLTCSGSEICYAGNCQSPYKACTPQNVTQDCGKSGFVGFPSCNPLPPPEQIIQDYDSFDCINNTCQESIVSQVIQDCPAPQICSTSQGSPECFSPLECTVNEDCPLGKICVSGNCTTEYAAINGTISSIWPFNVGEYFDSPSLPKIMGTVDYRGYSIIFPGSSETRCLKINEYVYPNSTSDNSYIRLNKAKTNISSGDSFQIWETQYGCTFI